MKVLRDTCVWRGALEALLAAGHEVEWVGDWPKDPGDEEVLRRAHDEERVLITLDKDFGELAIVHGLPHHGIIRLVGIRAREQGAIAAAAMGRYGELLQGGAILTVEPTRVRIREGKA